MNILGNLELIEVPVEGKTSIRFGNLNLLRDQKVKAVCVLKDGLASDGTTLEDPSNWYLRMKEKTTGEVSQTIPCKLITYSGTYPMLAFMPIDGRRYKFEDSEIIIADGAIPGANTTLQFAFLYE